MASLVVRKITKSIPSPMFAFFIYAIAAGYSMSALPLLIPEGSFSASQLTSWLTAAFDLGLLIGTLFSKQFISKFGHKIGFMILQIGFSISLFVLPVVQSQNFWLLDRFIGGVLVGGIFVVVESWLLKGTSEGRTKRLSVYMTMLYAGTAVGQMTLTWFGAKGATPFILSAGMLVIAAIILAILPNYEPEEDPVSSVHISSSGIHWVKIPAIIGCLISGMLLGSVYGIMPLQLNNIGMTQEQIGSLMAVMILGALAVQPIISSLSKKVGRTLLMSFLALLGAMSIGLFILFNELNISMFLLGMAIFAFYPVAVNLGSTNIPEEQIVNATQQMLLIYSIGSILGPIMALYFLSTQYGLFGFFFIILVTTSIYMLLVSMKGLNRVVIHK